MKLGVAFVFLSLGVLASATSILRPVVRPASGSTASGSASANNQGVNVGANVAGNRPAESSASANQFGFNSGRFGDYMNQGQDMMNSGNSWFNRGLGGSNYNNRAINSDSVSDKQQSNFAQNWGSNTGGNQRDLQIKHNSDSQSNGGNWYDQFGMGDSFLNQNRNFFDQGRFNEFTNSFANNAQAKARVA